jgi:hyperosmotically inducible protein
MKLATLMNACLILGVAALPACASNNPVGSAETSAHRAARSPALKDAWIDTRLETAYLFNSHLNNFNIQTDVDDGAVLLTGTVRSEIDKDLAEEIARGLNDVRSVDNQLTVKRSMVSSVRSSDDAEFSQKVDDATTTANVKTRLIANQHLAGLEIDVDTDNSVVTLSGEVGSDQERQLAGLIAKNTPDVERVRNELEVATTSGTAS